MGLIFGNKPAPEFGGQGFLEANFTAFPGIVISISSVVMVPIDMATQRSAGVLRRFRVTPLRPGLYLAADVLSRTALTFLSIATMYLIVIAAFGVRPDSAAALVSTLVATLLGLTAFLALGYLVAYRLRAVGADRLIERRLAGGLPVLGICVGLQVLFESSRERGHHEGLGQWPGAVERLDAPVVPHMGWSRVEAAEGSRLFAGVEGERFYFVHSYGVLSDPSERLDGRGDPPLVTWARHGTRFVAAVEDGPLSATQFHPEKSSDAGARLLGNWLSTLPTTHRRHQHDRHP